MNQRVERELLWASMAAILEIKGSISLCRRGGNFTAKVKAWLPARLRPWVERTLDTLGIEVVRFDPWRGGAQLRVEGRHAAQLVAGCFSHFPSDRRKQEARQLFRVSRTVGRGQVRITEEVRRERESAYMVLRRMHAAARERRFAKVAQ